MICIEYCINCKHKRPKLDGWRSCCDAFPTGKPIDFNYGIENINKECNDGVKYEPIDENFKL